MHLSLDEFNLLLGGKIDASTRKAWVAHMLECPHCTRDFKMLNELRTEMVEKAPARHGWKYGLVAAAVLALASLSVLLPESTSPPDLVPKSQVQVSTLNVLNQVHDVNRLAVAEWGERETVQSLLKKGLGG